MSRRVVIVGIAAIATAIGGGIFAWQATGQQDAPIELQPDITPTGLVTVNGEAISGELVAIFEANGMGHAEALNAAIEQVLFRQAAERLGLEASREEAVELVRDMEEGWAALNDEQRREVDALLIAQGLPTSNLADDPTMLEYGRAAATIGNVRSFLLERLAVAELTGITADSIRNPQELAAAKEGLDDQALSTATNSIIVQQRLEPEVERFVQAEREAAEITPIG